MKNKYQILPLFIMFMSFVGSNICQTTNINYHLSATSEILLTSESVDKGTGWSPGPM